MSKATIVLEAQSGQIRTATNDLRQLEQQGERAEKAGRNLTGVYKTLASVFATLGAARFVQSIISATVEQERVTAQLEQTLRSTGRYTPELSQNMQDYAAELQKVTTFGDEAIIGAQSLLLTFTQIGEDTMPKATEAVANVAIAMGTDLKSAALQVGKALNDPVRGLNALSRSGIQFSEAQRDLIKELVETNRVAEAQTVILGELETQFGGSARAARNTLGGAISSLKNAFGDLLEGDKSGQGVTGATKAINELTDALSSPEVVEAFGVAVQGIVSAVGAGAKGVKFLAENLDTLITVGQAVALVFGARVVGSATASAVAFSAAQIQAIRLQFAVNGLGASSGVAAAGITAMGAAAATAARGMALLGGPVGVIALAVGALVLFSDRAETASERSQRLARDVDDLTNSFKKLTEEQLRNEYNAQAARAFVTLPADLARVRSEIDKYTKVIDDANRAQAQGSGRESQYAVQSKEVKEARQNIERLNNDAKNLEEQMLLSERAVEKLGDQLANLNNTSDATLKKQDELTRKTKEQITEYQRLSESLLNQILVMQETEEVAERYQIMQRLGVDATEEEIAAIDTLLGRLNQLRAQREADRQAEQAAREMEQFQKGEERIGEDFGRLQGQLAISTSEDPEIVRLEQQLADRLALIDEYRMTAQANQLAADEAEIAAFEEVERQKTEITKREEEARKALQLQQIDATASFFGDIAQLAKNGGEEGFKIYKAAAIAQAVIGTYSSAVKAYDSLASIPVVGPALGAAAAAAAVAFGFQQVAAIKAQQPPGRALGGSVSAGSTYMVGERGPELMTPSTSGSVTPFNQLMDEARKGFKGSDQPQAPIINIYGADKPQTQQRWSDAERRWVIDVTVAEMRPGGRLHQAATQNLNTTTRTR